MEDRSFLSHMADIRALKHLVEPAASVKAFYKNEQSYSSGNEFNRIQAKIIQTGLLSRAVSALSHFRYYEKRPQVMSGFFFGVGQEINIESAVIGCVHPEDLSSCRPFFNQFDIIVVCWTSMNESDTDFSKLPAQTSPVTGDNFYVFATVYTKNFFPQTLCIKIDNGDEKVNSLSLIKEIPQDFHIGSLDWHSCIMNQHLAQTLAVSFTQTESSVFSGGVFEKMSGGFEVRLCLSQNLQTVPNRKRVTTSFESESKAFDKLEATQKSVQERLRSVSGGTLLNFYERFGYDKDQDDIVVSILNSLNLPSVKEF